MFEAHGTYPWKDWSNIWTYHTKFIPAGAAKLLIEQAIRISGKAHQHDSIVEDYSIGKMEGDRLEFINATVAFEKSGFLNKAFRVVRSYLDNDTAKVVAVYNHDGVYHLIEAEETSFLELAAKKFGHDKITWPQYPNEYHLESMRGG